MKYLCYCGCQMLIQLGFRNQVILNLMYASGARAQEICDLKVRDFLAEKDQYKLTVTGKGNKTRRIVIAKPSGILLRRYLITTGRISNPDSFIFFSQTHPKMTISCVEEIYKKYIAQARTEHPEMFLEKRYTPHTMRHTTATHMLEAGVPLIAIKNFLGPLSEEEKEIIRQVTNIINEKIAVPCTACEYCTHGCPKNIAIPQYFAIYNSIMRTTGGFSSQQVYYNNIAMNNHGKAGECIKCGKCEKACPQHLTIRKYLEEVAEKFEGSSIIPTRK